MTLGAVTSSRTLAAQTLKMWGSLTPTATDAEPTGPRTSKSRWRVYLPRGTLGEPDHGSPPAVAEGRRGDRRAGPAFWTSARPGRGWVVRGPLRTVVQFFSEVSCAAYPGGHGRKWQRGPSVWTVNPREVPKTFRWAKFDKKVLRAQARRRRVGPVTLLILKPVQARLRAGLYHRIAGWSVARSSSSSGPHRPNDGPWPALQPVLVGPSPISVRCV